MKTPSRSVRWTRSVAVALQIGAVCGALLWGWSIWAGSGAERGLAADSVDVPAALVAIPEITAEAPPAVPPAIPISARIDPTWLDTVSARNGIPRTALAAYAGAASVLAEQSPSCHLGWNTLAAIGHLESDDGRHGGAVRSDNGYPSVPILGPALDGGVFAGIHDSDGGAWDGDSVWDHAVGPFQFIPETWRRWGSDGNGDGRSDPNQIADAALAAAQYLCHAGDLSTIEGWRRAVFSYNHSESYVDAVASVANSLSAKSL
jgi:membrane-bound lytic murein transglycosylase B